MAEKKEEALTLGVDQVAVIRTKTGEAKLFKRNAFLSLQDRTLVEVPGVGILVSADGYKEMAAVGGLFVCNAPSVIVDGVAQPNPYLVKDSSGNASAVYCRCLAFGFTPTGVPSVSDRTVVFDLRLYKIVDLLSKAKDERNAKAFLVLPSDVERPGKTWAGYPIDEQTTLWVDTKSSEFLKWAGQMVNRARKATEIAQTFGQRNAIKHHPNIKVHKVNASTAMVPMLSWIPTSGDVRWDMSAFELTAKRMSELTGATKADGDAPAVQVVKGVDALHDDPTIVNVEAAAAADPEDAGLESPEEKPEPTDEEVRLDLAGKILEVMPSVKPKVRVENAFVHVDMDFAAFIALPIENRTAFFLSYHKEALASLLSMLVAARGNGGAA